jgi:hypothetical protein
MNPNVSKRGIALVIGLAGTLLIADAWVPGGFVFREAEAVIGRPATPGSVAGVARRSTRRMVRRTTMYVATLPPSCTTVIIEGTTLQQCGGTYYQASGSQYVVVNVE